MVDLERLMQEKLSSEMVEFLRMTMPNLGFFSLLDQARVEINQDLANLNTNCADKDFLRKYEKLIVEREVYDQLYTLASMFNNN